jgi:pyruvate/2-oxoglutarate dehydrogenase complex dihydrolipoamide dehydrogenase (E3) component
VQTGNVAVDLAKVRQRKRDIVESFRGGSRKRIEGSENVDLLDGEARFIESRTLHVRLTGGQSRELEADLIVINTGARPSVPRLDGLTDVPFLNSTTIMELERVPEHLLILGGGYIGVEFGQMFRRFGSDVTIVLRGSKLLAREDDDVADEVAKILQEDGIEILFDTSSRQVSRDGDTIRLTVDSPAGERTLHGSHLLVATGRTPNTDALDPRVSGIELDDRGHIKVDERLMTNVDGIYAVGDVTGGPAFTHISYDDFRILRANLTENGDLTTRDRLVPYTVFIDPQLGRVGLSESQARAEGRNIRVSKMPMSHVARALETDETRGLMKAVVDADSGQILGASILGIEGGEIMSAIQIAMIGKLPYTALRDGIFAHPTLMEALNNLFGTIEM